MVDIIICVPVILFLKKHVIVYYYSKQNWYTKSGENDCLSRSNTFCPCFLTVEINPCKRA